MSRIINENPQNQQISNALRCPNCLNQLITTECEHCGETFQTTLGIPDLRWPKPDERNRIKYNQLVQRLLNNYDKLTYHELVNLRYEGSKIPAHLQEVYRDYQSNLIERGNVMLEMFQKKRALYYHLPSHDMALDIGCGVGASTIYLANKFDHVIGIDPSLPSLILARKFLDENEAHNITLLQAYAQNIPVQEQVIDYAVAQNVIEHLFTIKPAFDEIYRILKHEGCFIGDSRNRYDLFLPEPHAKLRWVGLWPRKLQPWYVRRFRNASYDSAYLLSFHELNSNAKKVFGKSYQITFPLSTAYGRSPKWDKYLAKIENIPLLNKMFLHIFPSHLLVAQICK